MRAFPIVLILLGVYTRVTGLQQRSELFLENYQTQIGAQISAVAPLFIGFKVVDLRRSSVCGEVASIPENVVIKAGKV